MNRHLFGLIVGGLGTLTATVVLLAEVVVLADLFPFEYRPLAAMLGIKGLVAFGLLNAGLLVALHRSWGLLRSRAHRRSIVGTATIFAASVLLVWILEWTFIETPLTLRAQLAIADESNSPAHERLPQDFATSALAGSAFSPTALGGLITAYDRIRLTTPDVYERSPILETIERYAKTYEVDSSLLFTIAYIDSFYGEATSGPVPFVRAMSAETIRDVIQIHLPAWFDENPLRTWLIRSDVLPRALGESVGFKLRYALQKSNLDVSAQPFSSSTFSVVFAMMRAFPEEFPDVFVPQTSDPLRTALRESFLQIRESAVVQPYEEPYRVAPYSSTYYQQSRESLKRFSRAAYYLTASDFDFATRTQALMLRYRQDYYLGRLGEDKWAGMPQWQRNALSLMVQDIYTPNIGRLSYNLYSSPELTCSALGFVADAAAQEREFFGPRQDRMWRPQNYDILWGGAGYQLAVLNEIWQLVNDEPIPGVGTGNTLDYASRIVALRRSRIE